MLTTYIFCFTTIIFNSHKFNRNSSNTRIKLIAVASFNLKLNIQNTKIMASGPITSWQIGGETVADFILGGSKIMQMVSAAMKLKDAYSLEGKL